MLPVNALNVANEPAEATGAMKRNGDLLDLPPWHYGWRFIIARNPGPAGRSGIEVVRLDSPDRPIYGRFAVTGKSRRIQKKYSASSLTPYLTTECILS